MTSCSLQEDMTVIRIIAFSGNAIDWDEWSEKFQALATDKGNGDIITGTQTVPDDGVDDGALKTLRKANAKGYRDLQLSTSGLVFRLVK